MVLWTAYWCCHQMCDNVGVAGLWWEDEDADYIRRRSDRYPGALNIEPEWTLEAAADPRAIVRNPDPKSHTGAIRLIGYSPGAGFVLTVIADAAEKISFIHPYSDWPHERPMTSSIAPPNAPD